jgi:hypothetical protein
MLFFILKAFDGRPPIITIDRLALSDEMMR